MTLSDVRASMRQAGYTRVRTHGGYVPIQAWDPYGMETINREFFRGAPPWQGQIVAEGIVSDVVKEGCIGGVWFFEKGDES